MLIIHFTHSSCASGNLKKFINDGTRHQKYGDMGYFLSDLVFPSVDNRSITIVNIRMAAPQPFISMKGPIIIIGSNRFDGVDYTNFAQTNGQTDTYRIRTPPLTTLVIRFCLGPSIKSWVKIYMLNEYIHQILCEVYNYSQHNRSKKWFIVEFSFITIDDLK